jgi:hypothetical protein
MKQMLGLSGARPPGTVAIASPQQMQILFFIPHQPSQSGSSGGRFIL